VNGIPECAKYVIEKLSRAGYEAYLVGGCVRDMLLGIAPHDWDITTSALPEETMRVFADDRVIETGVKHGTVTVVVNGEPLEVTTYRIDGDYADNRHPIGVTFSKSLREDLARRDFTVNAMAFNPRDGIADFFGGRADLENGVIRCVGNAEKRFNEDGLRIMRAVRFAATYGFTIEPDTASALHSCKELLGNISYERISSELTKLLCGKAAGDMLREFADVICTVLPELAPMIGFDQRNFHHDKDIWQHTVAAVEAAPAYPALRWSALLHDVGKPECFSIDEGGVGHFHGHTDISARISDGVMHRLRFDNATRERVVLLVKSHDRQIEPTEKAVSRCIRQLGYEAFLQLLELKKADTLAQAPEFHGRTEQIEQLRSIAEGLLEKDACLSLKSLAVNGRDLMPLGYKGKEIGAALDALLDAVMDGRVQNEKEKLLEYLGKTKGEDDK
jgi:tRNA nucleotidyltransferase (CCA-adding enzyme)